MDSEKCDQRVTVDYIVYESERAGWERTNKRLWIENIVDKVIIVIVIGLFLWLLYGTEFESYELDADGNSIGFIGDDMRGDITNGSANTGEESETNERSEAQSSKGESENR